MNLTIRLTRVARKMHPYTAEDIQGYDFALKTEHHQDPRRELVVLARRIY